MHFASPSDDIYPYLLVNIGSGVSFLKVSGPREYERVGGTSLGGGTLWGLLSLLTGATTFDEMLDLASRGDNTKVDMLVGDIYGTDYGKIGLKSTTIASSFGKVFRMTRPGEGEDAEMPTNGDSSMTLRDDSSTNIQDDSSTNIQGDSRMNIQDDTSIPHTTQQDQEKEEQPPHLKTFPADPATGEPRFSAADVSRSLLYMVSNNIGQIAFLQSRIHGLSHIYFGGSFIRGHPQTMNTLSYAIKFWSGGSKQAYFLRHEGYLGAVGAFLKRQPRNWGRRGSFDEGSVDWQEMRRRERERDAS
jgi:type II pantothenate kinase